MIDNLLGIKSSAELAKEEERLSKARAAALYDSGALDKLPAGRFETLSFIHRELFGEIYEFAGKIRTVNISKGGFRFASCIYLEEALGSIDAMPQQSFEQIIEKYVEMNIAHPFREGNGRSMRIWLDHILKSELGKVIDWSRVEKEDYLLAMERSPVRDTEIKLLLKDALTDKADDREIYIKGIDKSYEYEGYSLYTTGELLNGGNI
ncbi:MAG: Fic family protein [Ruminococcus sp.]|nr:Fic family protein [Ruminococcus sp.]